MNKMPFNYMKNLDKAEKEIRKEKSNVNVVVRELNRAYNKALVNGLFIGSIVCLAAVGANSLYQSSKTEKE